MDSEGRAALSAGDQAISSQVLLNEVVAGRYEIGKASPTTEYLLPNPFGTSPAAKEVYTARQLHRANQGAPTLFCSRRNGARPGIELPPNSATS